MISRARGSRCNIRRHSSRPETPGQVDVDHGDVGLLGEIGGIAGLAVGGVDDLGGRIDRQQRLAARDDDRMVIDYQNTHGPRSPIGLAPRRLGQRSRRDSLMWRKVSLRHRINLLFAALLLAWLVVDVARILTEAGPRARAESESMIRLMSKFVSTALANVQDSPEPTRDLAAMVANLAICATPGFGWSAPAIRSSPPPSSPPTPDRRLGSARSPTRRSAWSRSRSCSGSTVSAPS